MSELELERVYHLAKAFCEADLEYLKMQKEHAKQYRGRKSATRHERHALLKPLNERRRQAITALRKILCNWEPSPPGAKKANT